MKLLQSTCAAITPTCQKAALLAQTRMDNKTKPRGSLGRLEELACRLAAIYGTTNIALPEKAVVVMAADHGAAEEGISAYPQEVTAQMVRNFAAGGAAINVLARLQQARVIVVNMGTKLPLDDLPSIRSHCLGAGTANFTHGPAMSRETAVLAVEIGIALAAELREAGVGLLAVGEMGIGNTTAASAITAAVLGMSPAEVTGRGTGVDDERLAAQTAGHRAGPGRQPTRCQRSSRRARQARRLRDRGTGWYYSRSCRAASCRWFSTASSPGPRHWSPADSAASRGSI